MKNIPHLEDVAFLYPNSAIKELMAALIFNLEGQDIGELSIKYDGSPCIVFGNEEGFFVSTKGYFNKTPIRYRSIEDINNSNKDPLLKDKLAAVFHEFKDTRIPSDVVHTGDWLFQNCFNHSASYVFRPNIIEYRTKIDLSRYLLGLAIHGTYFCGQRYKHSLLKASGRVLIPNVDDIDLSGVDEHKLFNYLNHLLYIPEKLDSKQTKKFRSELGQLVKKFDKYHSSQLSFLEQNNRIRDNLDLLIRFKYYILSILNTGRHNTYPFQMFINGEQTTHEGYVFRYKDIVVKLVDRYKFSKANFDGSTERGWNLNIQS